MREWQYLRAHDCYMILFPQPTLEAPGQMFEIPDLEMPNQKLNKRK